jgi:hypothetical protein
MYCSENRARKNACAIPSESLLNLLQQRSFQAEKWMCILSASCRVECLVFDRVCTFCWSCQTNLTALWIPSWQMALLQGFPVPGQQRKGYEIFKRSIADSGFALEKALCTRPHYSDWVKRVPRARQTYLCNGDAVLACFQCVAAICVADTLHEAASLQYWPCRHNGNVPGEVPRRSAIRHRVIGLL